MFATVSYVNVKQKITYERDKPSLIVFNKKSTYNSLDSQKEFLKQLGFKVHSNFSKIKSLIAKLGFSHDKFQLYHEEIKTAFYIYTLNSKSGKLESMNEDFYLL